MNITLTGNEVRQQDMALATIVGQPGMSKYEVNILDGDVVGLVRIDKWKCADGPCAHGNLPGFFTTCIPANDIESAIIAAREVMAAYMED